MADIPTIRLNTGTSIPAVGFGTWQLAEGREARQAVGEAISAGYRLIDTAMIYGNEKSVGQAISDSEVPRSAIFVTTKLWPTDFGYDSSLKAFDDSLTRLGLDYIDLYLMHWPETDKHARQESWRALIRLNRDGLAKAIGVSNYDIQHLEEAMSSGTVPAVNQIPFNPFTYKEQRSVLEFSKKHNITAEAYSPLARAHQLNNPTLKQVAKKYAKTPAQVMLRWAIEHETIPIPKSAHSDRIKENLDVFNFQLSEEDIQKLNTL